MGELAVTHAYAREALALFQARDDKDGLLAGVESVAAALLAEGRLQSAARLLAAAEAQREALGPPGVPWWRRPHERIVAAMRAVCLEHEGASAWAEGRTMTLDQAVEHALTQEGSDS